MNTPCFNIAAVERETGLSKDVLRMWERRYGFPVPERDGHGERSYSIAQVERLRLVKRLMDQGHRPGKLLAMPEEELLALAPRRPSSEGSAAFPDTSDLEEALALIKRHDSQGFLQAMQQRLARDGLMHFVQDTVAPLTRRVGDAWEDGDFAVFEEHLYTELTKRVLRQALAALPPGRRTPRVLLTSLPDEPHMLGLLMVEALLSLEGAECIPLGTEMPLLDLVRACEAHRADVVALSFSSVFPLRQIGEALRQLRQALPAGVVIWAGGAGMLRAQPLEGVQTLTDLAMLPSALNDWRLAHSA
nr:MerR family transcriptional regulator [Dechloromonas sp.]